MCSKLVERVSYSSGHTSIWLSNLCADLALGHLCQALFDSGQILQRFLQQLRVRHIKFRLDFADFEQAVMHHIYSISSMALKYPPENSPLVSD